MPDSDTIENANNALSPDSEQYKLLQYDKDGDGQLDGDEMALAEAKLQNNDNEETVLP